MADYTISFVGHIVPSFRPHGFPAFVRDDMVCRVESLDGLRKMTNEKYISYIRNGGMFVYVNPAQVDDSKYVPDAQMFIPMHMISYINTITKKLASDIPNKETALLQ